jgi:hypothetical protein
MITTIPAHTGNVRTSDKGIARITSAATHAATTPRILQIIVLFNAA